MSRLVLCIPRKDQVDEQFPIELGVPATVGDAEVVIDAARGAYALTLRSGTAEVGGVSLRADIPRRILLGEDVHVDARVGVLKLDAGADVRTFEVALGLIDVIAKIDCPFVEVVEGPALGARFTLEEEGRPRRVGRDAASVLDLRDPLVSRWHLSITRKGGDALVRDLASTSGTTYGRVRLAPNRDARWIPDRHIKLGDTVLALRGVVGDGTDTPSDLLVNEPPPAVKRVAVDIADVAESAPPMPAPEVAVAEGVAGIVVAPLAKKAPKPSPRFTPARLIAPVGIAFVVACVGAIVWLLVFSK